MALVAVQGGELYLETVGKGDLCVTVHGGFGFDHSALSPWLDRLGEVMRVVYYDQRGCGRSSRAGMDELTIERLRDDLDAVREHLGAASITLFGHGWGSCVALEYALAFPQRVKSLILVSGVPSFPMRGEPREAVLQRGAIDAVVSALSDASERDESLEHAIRASLPLLFYDAEDERVRSLFSRVLWSSPAALQWRRIFDGWNVRQRLAELAVPTLLLAGQYNSAFPISQSLALYEGIVNSTLEVFERSGHFPFVEEPEAFFRVVFDWLEEMTLV
ncbi:alpha/beta fold hydrolase [bacterium]|nr:MAG: alpha/beta fold hydrolase [bacterium]